MSASNLHIAWAKLFLHAAWCAGVRDVVVSPGSRSTPLALAAHESTELRSHFIVDERTAAFFALGQARVTGRPTLLACTSGTAGAHYYPAVIEASMSGLPLVVVTADRPWELQQTGASQTIDQTHLFGSFVRTFAALGAPEPGDAALRALARTAAQVVARALGPEPGPVHVNAPFRKPLEPIAAPEREPWTASWEALMQGAPTRSIAPRPSFDAASLDHVARLFQTEHGPVERGLIVCGPAPAHGDLDAYQRELGALARATGFPILAEATSQARFGHVAALAATGSAAATTGTSAAPVVLSAFDALLRAPTFRKRFVPDAILELGAPPTSAGYAQLLAENPRCPRVVVAPLGWTDPASTASTIVHADVLPFCRALRVRLGDRPHPASEWSRALAAEDARARAIIDATLASPALPTTLTEAATARAVVDACPAGSILVLGNSSPVRDVDIYCHTSARPLRVLHQRGASGIDGLVSGAAGAHSVADGAAVSLLLGDLSLLHDLTGLVLARAARAPLVITVVNNGGGRIFEQLPIGRALHAQASADPRASGDARVAADPRTTGAARAAADTFERCFATPQQVDLAAAAATFGIPFARATTAAELTSALAAAHARPAATLIEAVVPPHDGAERTRTIWTRIDEPHPSRKDDPS